MLRVEINGNRLRMIWLCEYKVFGYACKRLVLIVLGHQEDKLNSEDNRLEVEHLEQAVGDMELEVVEEVVMDPVEEVDLGAAEEEEEPANSISRCHRIKNHPSVISVIDVDKRDIGFKIVQRTMILNWQNGNDL